MLLSLSRAGVGQLASAPVIAPAAPTLAVTAQSTSKVASTVALSLATPTSIIYGQTIDGLAQVTAIDGSTVTGTVTFYDGAAGFCTLTLADGASCPPGTETGFGAGTHVFTAIYTGDAAHAGATSNPVAVTVAQDTTTTALASSANQVVRAGSSVVYTASVTAAHGPVTGTVMFRDGSASMGSAVLDANGAATLSSLVLTPGSHAITAMYTGNANSAPSTSTALEVVVQAALATTATTLTTSANPATFGEGITFTATVTTPGTRPPTGAVTLVEGGVVLGTATLNATGTATWSTSTLSLGTHNIVARYAGDADSAPSISPAIMQEVSDSTPPNTFTVGVGQITVVAGETALVPIKIAAGSGFAKALTLSCGGLPEEASCPSVSGTAAAAAGSSTLTLKISTAAPRDCGSTTPYGSQPKSSLPFGGSFLAGLLLALVPKRRRPLKHLLMALFAITTISGVSGCGTGNCTDLGTRPGTYTITITGQAGGATISQKVMLIVKP